MSDNPDIDKSGIWLCYKLPIAMILICLAFITWRTNSPAPPITMMIWAVPLFLGWGLISIVVKVVKQDSRRRVVALVLVGLLTILAASYVYYFTSGAAIFRRNLADPIPRSVHILSSEYQGGMDPAVYLHFTLEPKDFAAILEARHFSKRSMNEPFWGHPSWWLPGSMQGAVMYCTEPDSSAEPRRSVEWLWSNRDGTEVYFACWNL